MIYHAAFYNIQGFHNPFAQFRSATPFHSVAVGQHVSLPDFPRFQVDDVTHAFTRDAAGEDHCMIMLLVSPALGSEGGESNPVPWPW